MVSIAEKWSEPEAHIETRDEKAYRKVLEDYLSPATMMIGLLIGLLLYRMPYPVAEQLGDALAINEDEGALIIPPAARILDKQHFDVRVKKAIQSSGDTIGLLMGVGAYFIRTIAVMQEVSAQINAQSRGQTPQQAVQPGSASSNGHNQGAGAVPPGGWGYINAGGLLGS